MQSPTMFAGLHGIATRTWLRFVASPQRMPALGYRLRGQTVVSVIDSASPLVVAATSALPRGREPGRASGCGPTCPRQPTPTTAAPTASTDPGTTFEIRLRRPRRSCKPVHANRARRPCTQTMRVRRRFAVGGNVTGRRAPWAIAPQQGQRGGLGPGFTVASRSASGSTPVSAASSAAGAECASNSAAMRPR